MIKREKAGRLAFFIFLIVGFFLPVFSLARQEAPPVKTPEMQAPAQSEKSVAAPQNIKEASRIYVFLGWMWVSIVVLIYFLRLKIREADRLYRIKFFSPAKK